MIPSLLIAALLQGGVSPPAAAAPSPSQIAAAAPAADWHEIAASDLAVFDLSPLAGRPRRIVIQLIGAPFSQEHVGNIRRLLAAHWFDGTSVNRVQDNYVVQWGDATEKKPLPPGLATVPVTAYEADLGQTLLQGPDGASEVRQASVKGGGAGAFVGRVATLSTDPYAVVTMIREGWPIASGTRTATGPTPNTIAWPVHCYGMVGVGRGLSPDTGTGAELYAVIGHAPRHLDGNIAVVGRVVEGIEHLSSLPRGTGALGFYETAEERVPIVSARLASEMPAAERPRFDYLATESPAFAAYMNARRNREPPFFIRPAGGADVCNIPVPIRRH